MRSSILAEIWPFNSTNGRSTLTPISWPWVGMQVLGFVAPAIAQERALKLFLTPPPPRATPAKLPEFSALLGDTFRVKLATAIGGIDEVTSLEVNVWGRGPAVYLLHGWGGRSSQWSSFVAPLVRAGFTVVAFDAPGHGESAATRTSIPHFAAALDAVVGSVGPARAIIGHSMGGDAASLALWGGLATEKVVFIGSPADPPEYFAGFLRQIGLPEHLHRAIGAKFEREYGFRSHDLTVRPPRHVPDLPALVVHDRDDREVSYTNGERIARAFPNATLMSTSGLGHRRILRDESVIDRVVAFVADRA
ncbi:MAG: alpha/beta fold hydrolase [Polyangiaceae bacterium]